MKTLICALLVLLMLGSANAWAAPSVPFSGGLRSSDFVGDLGGLIDVGVRGELTPYLSLTSGILTGGEVTINGGDNTKFDVAAGTGAIIGWTNEETPTFTYVTWDAFTAVTVDEIATTGFSILGINAAGGLVQGGGAASTPEQRRSFIWLQNVIHVNNTIIDSVGTASQPSYEMVQNLMDVVIAMGPTNFANTYVAAGTDLTIKKIAGTTASLGINRANNLQSPNILSNPEQDPVTQIIYSFRDGSGGFNTVIRSVIDPEQFDDGSGTLAAVGVNKVQIQRLIFFGEGGGITAAVYGQEEYMNQGDALAAIMAENPAIPPSTLAGKFVTALVVEKGTTDLSVGADAMFVNQE